MRAPVHQTDGKASICVAQATCGRSPPHVRRKQWCRRQQCCARQHWHAQSRQARHIRRHLACHAAGTSQATDSWSKARAAFQAGTPHEGRVRGVNKGGILIDCWGVAGFIPNSMLWSATARPEEGMKVKAFFVEVNELQNRMILSQKQVQQTQLLQEVKEGDVVEGKVAWIEAYGAFVDIGLKSGQTVSGMIHKSELSWGAVIVPDTVVSVGEWVKCKVLSVEPTRGRVALSLKQMQADPLDQSLQSILPTGDEEVDWKDSSEPLPGLEEVVNGLLKVEGINDIKYGRQASLPGHVAQDVELWLSTTQVSDHWTVLARSESAVQELAVYATLSKQELAQQLNKVGKPASASS